MDRIDWFIEIGKLLLGFVFIVGLASCSSEAGWQVQFGVSPVTQIDSRQQHDIARAKVREAKY